MPAPRPNVKSGKMIQMLTDFSAGLNTIGAVHQIEDTEFAEGQNADIDELGSVSKRRGFSRLPSQPEGRINGMYAFRGKGYRKKVAVVSGRLCWLDVGESDPRTLLKEGTWKDVPIRIYRPGRVRATEGTAESTLTPSTTYEYKVVAKDSTGSTEGSEPYISGGLNVSRVTLSASPKAVILLWDKSLGATQYAIYRAKVTSGIAEEFQYLATVDDVATWTDTGANSPVAGVIPPISNTTSYTLANQDASYVSWNNFMYVTTGNGLVVWDGEGDASIVAPYIPTDNELSVVGANAYTDHSNSIHTCRLVEMHGDRLFLCGDGEQPQNVYFTDLGVSPAGGKFAYMPGTYAFDVTTDNNEPVTGMAKFRHNLVIFTRGSIHTLFGKQPNLSLPDAYDLRLTNNAIGCESPRSIVPVHNSLVFVGKQGIYALVSVTASDVNLNVQYVSHKIEPTFRKLRGSSKCVATFHDYQYKVSFPEEGVVLRWYPSRQAWTLDYNETARFTNYLVWDVDLYQSTSDAIYKMGYKADVSGEVPVYSDDGQPIDFSFRTKSFDMRAIINLKKFRTMYIMAKQYEEASTAHVKVVVDYVGESYDFSFNESTVWGEWILGHSRLGWVDVVFQEVRHKAKGHQVYFVVSNNKVDEPVTIYGLGLEFKIKKA